MSLYRVILVFFLLFPVGIFSHDNSFSKEIGDEYSFKTKTYGKKEGYNIKSKHASLVDSYGTLWVGGKTENLIVNQLNKGGVGIFFFNGTRFQEYPLKDDLKKAEKIQLLAGKNNKFFVLFKFKNDIKLFTINPITLECTEVIQPIKDIVRVKSVKIVRIKNEQYIIYNYNKRSTFYKITKDYKFEPYLDHQFNTKGSSYFERVIRLKQNTILNDIHSGIYILNEANKSLHKVTGKDLGVAEIEEEKNKKLKIVNHFKYRDTVFIQFGESNDYYYFNENKATWQTTNTNRFPFTERINYKLFCEKSEFLYFLMQKNGEVNSLNFYLKKDNRITASISLPEFNNVSIVKSRNFNKEVFVMSKNQLIQISFHKKKVKSFLKKYSIRSLSQLSENRVLVGTEQNGLLEINLLTGEEKRYFENTLECDLSLNTGSVVDSSGVYTNCLSGMCYIDRKTKLSTCYRNFPISTMTSKGDNIYYGTNGYKLFRFDKKLKKHFGLIDTKDIFIEGITFVGDTILCATHSGLLIYYKGTKEVINIPNANNKLLCIIKHPTLGILIGSVDGIMYQYNLKSKQFTILYNDVFNSSIATLLVDDNNNLWINSFKGIINYKIKDKTVIRYGVHDGFTHNEANRHSTLKLRNGNILIGTLRGLNYFNPNQIVANDIDASLRINGIKYIDDSQKELNIISIRELNNLKKIVLTPQNRNVNISFGFSDLLGLNEDLKYKYKLNDGPWRIGNDFGELFLGNLAPDNYVLEIIAINQLESEIGTSLKLTIIAKQFLYKTSSFLIFISLLIGMVIFWITFQYIRNQKLRQYFSDKIINAHLVEQVLLSHRLHDSVGQKLLLTKNNLILHKKIPKEELTNLDEVISEIRNISHDLHPIQFKELGLKKSVENLVNDFQRNSSLYYSHEIDSLDLALTLEKGLILFGIVQECLNNVERHSEAEACRVKIYTEGKKLKLQIRDNGKGFEKSKISKNFSLGLKTIKEKAGYLDANLSIISKLNEGTLVELSIKLK